MAFPVSFSSCMVCGFVVGLYDAVRMVGDGCWDGDAIVSMIIE